MPREIFILSECDEKNEDEITRALKVQILKVLVYEGSHL